MLEISTRNSPTTHRNPLVTTAARPATARSAGTSNSRGTSPTDKVLKGTRSSRESNSSRVNFNDTIAGRHEDTKPSECGPDRSHMCALPHSPIPPSSMVTMRESPEVPRSSRLSKPPVPQFSARQRRPRTVQQSSSDLDGGVPVTLSDPAVVMYPMPMYPFHFPAPMMMPMAPLYGQVQPHSVPGTTIVYTSGPIPPNTTSIIFVNTAGPAVVASTPSPPPVSMIGSNSSVSSDPVTANQPLVVFIERNAFKHWFESNVPEIVRELPFKVKRYKSVETFLHWLTSRKKYEQLELNILMRVTEINRLLTDAKNVKSLRIFAYEHLFDLSQQPGKSTRFDADSVSSRRDFDVSRLAVCHCLEEACRKLVASHPN